MAKTVKSLLGQNSESAAEGENQREATDFPNWLNTQNAAVPQPPAPVAEPIHRMIVLSATGMREFEWYNENTLPTEVTAPQTTAGPAASAPSSTDAAAPLPDDADNVASQDDDLEFELNDN